MIQQKKSEFTDCQILLAIRSLKTCTQIELLEFCIINFGKFKWNYDIVRNSIVRLKNKNKIILHDRIIDTEYRTKTKTYLRKKRCKFISFNNDRCIL
jgi:hypothetical protein